MCEFVARHAAIPNGGVSPTVYVVMEHRGRRAPTFNRIVE
jgi:hypothetical protein